jgi:signal peptidase
MLRPAVRSLLVALTVWLVASAATLMVMASRHDRLLSVQTASMVPTFRPGDAVIVQPVRLKQLRPGEVISYQSSENARLVISHRLVRINRQNGWLTTAGDALPTPDPAFPPSQLIGQVTTVAPGLGRLLDALRRPLGLVLLVYLPAAVVLGAELTHLARSYARPFYSARLET